MSEREYTVDLQKLFVEFLAQDLKICLCVLIILDVDYFDRNLRKAVDFVQQHAREYSALGLHLNRLVLQQVQH